jgi:tRNA threonylcarbamoyladenosine biosynthesis protein TsaB
MNTEFCGNTTGSQIHFLLGIDTCGPSGSVALGCLTGMHTVKILAQKDLEGRTYSATLVSAVSDLLAEQGIRLNQVGCIVAVHGPGSFTGVRVGLSAVKGLAEPFGTPVVAVSRLEVLAKMAGVLSSALDAHRHEIFLRLADSGLHVNELLAGRNDLAEMAPASRVAVCDQAAAAVLESAWPNTVLVHVAAPTAADALALAAPDISSGQFVDLALLDGHYLRRSDAEIFGTPSPRSS